MWALADLDGSIVIGANIPSAVPAPFLPVRRTEERVVFLNANMKTFVSSARALDSSVGVLDNLAGNTRTDAGTPTARRARSLHCEVADFARTAVATQATAADSPAEVHVDLSGSKSSPSWTSARRLLLSAPSSSSASRQLGSNIADIPREQARAAGASAADARGHTPSGCGRSTGRCMHRVSEVAGAGTSTEGRRRRCQPGARSRSAGHEADDEQAEAGDGKEAASAGRVRPAGAERQGGAAPSALSVQRCQRGSRPPRRRAHAGPASVVPRPRP